MSFPSARRRARQTIPLTLMGSLVAAQMVFTPGAHAAEGVTLNVNTVADGDFAVCADPSVLDVPDTLSLREAVCLANNGVSPAGTITTINVPSGVILVANEPIAVAPQGNRSIVIDGAGPGQTVIDGNNNARLFELDADHAGGADVTISDLALHRGRDTSGAGGAAIRGGSYTAENPDSLRLSNVRVTSNSSVGTLPYTPGHGGGAIRWAGGHLSLTDAHLSNNTSGANPGGAISYASTGHENAGHLDVLRSTFSSNTVTTTGAGIVNGGGALHIVGNTEEAVSNITSSTFNSNSVTGTGLGRGGAIFTKGGHLNVNRSAFTSNFLFTGADAGSGAGGAFAFFGGSADMHYNRIVYNAAGSSSRTLNTAAAAGYVSETLADLTNNWWGCGQPPANMCQSIGTTNGSTYTATPSLATSLSSNPESITGANATSTLTATLTRNSAGQTIPGNLLTAFDGVPAMFDIINSPGAWKVSESFALYLNGSASTTFSANGTFGTAVIATNMDQHQQRASAAVRVGDLPTFTSTDNYTLTAGESGSFTITATGYPTPTIVPGDSVVPVPPGMVFSAGLGTATISGTPTAPGTYPITLTARSAAGTTTQEFTLTVAKKSQSLTVTSSPPGVVGSTYDIAANSTSGLPPVFSVSDQTTGDACTMADGDTVALDHAGTCVIDITQPGDDGYSPAAPLQHSFGVNVIGTDLRVSTSVDSAPYGQPLTATAVLSAPGGAAAGDVQFSVDGDALGDPHPVTAASDGSVTVPLTDNHGRPLEVGDHDVAASFSPTEATKYASSASNVATFVVNKAATTSNVKVTASTVTSTVTATAPGAGVPSGEAVFTLNGVQVGTAPLVSGTATLTYKVPAGLAASLAVSYSGDDHFTGSSASAARLDPTITAKVTSTSPVTSHGWYRTAVTATFTCTTNGAELVEACPAPVTMSTPGAGKSLTKTITATDGGTATVVVSGINIDLGKPTVKVAGPRAGAIYNGTAPKATCAATDPMSGVATCTLTQTRSGNVVRYKAAATDKAGNIAAVGGSYRVRSIWIAGAYVGKARWQVTAGKAYTVVVLSAKRPAMYYATRAPRVTKAGRVLMRNAGKGRWVATVVPTSKMARTNSGRYNLGVKIGAAKPLKVRMHVRR